MNKSQLKEELTKIGVSFEEDATNKELEELIEANPVNTKTDKGEAGDEVKTPENDKKSEKADVYNSKEAFVRSYTEEMSDAKDVENGKDFIEKAKGFARKIGGTVKIS